VTGEDLFLSVKEAVVYLDLGCKELSSVITDGARNVYGSDTGIVE
jgi:hypothetical protein